MTDIFDSLFKTALNNLDTTNSYLSTAENEELKFSMGLTDNTHDLSIALNKASIALQYTVAVRDKVLELEREIAKHEHCIMDGRDIGTVVLPDATLKIFMIATPEIQAKRRYDQLAEMDKLGDATYESILADIKERDYRDSHRENAPLKKADDAIEVDTSELTKEEVIETVWKLLQQKLQGSVSE